MKRLTHGFLVLMAVSALSLAACDKKEADGDKKADDDKKADADKPSLLLKSDTPECRKALTCCEAMVAADKGEATPENINLSCSGVGMAKDDDTCKEFKKGYAMSIEASGKPVPDDCK